MDIASIATFLGPIGFIPLLGLIVGGLIRGLKTGAVARVLDAFGLPPIPKRALPWTALALGVLGAALDARIGGAAWLQVAISAIQGLFAGALAIAGDQTVGNAIAPGQPTPATEKA